MSGHDAAVIRLENEHKSPSRDLSLYVHIPYCERLCRYCACTRQIRNRSTPGTDDLLDAYIAALEKEIRRLAAASERGRRLRQVHWGGGTPTYVGAERVERIHAAVCEAFDVASDAEVAMEIDPRTLTTEMLQTLRRVGFNRLSLGVQDFDAKVQEHVRRVQPFKLVRDTLAACRGLGFDSVNFDLIYGMPYQTLDTIRDTIYKTIELGPDRVAYYHYAQIPEKIATQRGMDYTRLPDSETKLEMWLLGLELFEQAGYDFIGLDHFAKPEEHLSRAKEDESLQRNFQGMTTGAGLDLLGAGASSISHLLGLAFLQNVKDADAYIESMNNGGEPVERGKRLSFDDRVRQSLMNQLYCHAVIRPEAIERAHGIDFSVYFGRELEILGELERDGLVRAEDDGSIRATMPLGRLLLRNIAAVFDAYLDPEAYSKGETACFSKNA
jgi:oxygen-independent coproporphyrinogen-3 oxidase